MTSADNPPTIVLVDGRSGAGKTQYATRLASDLGARLVSLDDIYPGWDGLDAGSWHAWHNLIIPISTGRPGSYRVWAWHAMAPGETITLEAGEPLVVEGCGAMRADGGELKAKKIWIDAPELERRERAFARDGGLYVPHWERWARQEERFIAAHHGPERADEVVLTG
jgi:hypothetical protein